jgi:cytidylate kinase
MIRQTPFVITISRQLGCGGSYFGQRLASLLGVKYADHEILQQAAAELGDDVDLLASRDETVSRFWDIVQAYFVMGPPDTTYQPPQLHISSDRELYDQENAIIERLTREESAVIIGHGGFHVLREHPAHVSIYFHAPTPFRVQRVKALYEVTEDAARHMIAAADTERERYIRALSGKSWTDLRNYQLTLDSSALSFPAIEELLLAFLAGRGITPVK